MAGISSRAAGGVENRKKFNGIEETRDLDLNQYDAFFRTMDPQIGRWWQIDPKPNFMESPYAAMGNNPIFNMDPLGDTIKLSAAFMNNRAAMKAFNLLKNTQAFKDQYSQFDVAGGVLGGKENGEQSANTNISIDLYSNKEEGGITNFSVQNNDGSSSTVARSDPSKYDKNSLVTIDVKIDINSHKSVSQFAYTLNHEFNTHGTPFLKTLSMLRENGSSSFFKEYKSSSSYSPTGDNRSTMRGKYNVPMFQHAQAMLGDNIIYNAALKQMRNQMSPTERTKFDATQRRFDKVYTEDKSEYLKMLNR